MLRVSDEAVEVILLLLTLATQEARNANAPEEAGILCLSAGRSRIEGSLQTAWPGSYPPPRGEKGGKRLNPQVVT